MEDLNFEGFEMLEKLKTGQLLLGEEGVFVLVLEGIINFFLEGKKIIIPLFIQVHQTVCDGFHVSWFINEF